MKIMENQFYIKKGSLCFIIPVFTEKSKVCDKYLNKLAIDLKRINDEGLDKNGRRKCRRNTIKGSKLEFINDPRIYRHFPNIQTNFQSAPKCTKTYEGRFLCQCCASAIKFHDDGIQKKNTMQFHLDSFNIKYHLENDGNDKTPSSIEDAFECSFNMNVILYLMHEEDEKIAYLLFEVNMADIEDFCIINDTSTFNNYVKSEQIIFIKHLFYKSKMTVQINDKKSDKENLQEWVNDYIKRLCMALEIEYKGNVPEYIEEHAFKYSFIELKEVCNENGDELDIDFNEMNRFLDNHSQQIYGLLLSDEGWVNTPKHVVKDKLQDYWTTRDYICTFFLQHNALLFNLRESTRGKKLSNFSKEWYSIYQDGKYKEYVSSHPCLTGIDTLAIFTFLNAIYKEINLDRFEWKFKNEKNENVSNTMAKIKVARRDLKLLQEIMNKTSLKLGEIVSMETYLYKHFGIIEKTKRIKELYEQQVNTLNFDYNDANNKIINKLTIITIIIGFFSLIISSISIDFSWIKEIVQNILQIWMLIKFHWIIIIL